jgi:asparagine synthase (glutamine-hydrolysing)
MEDSLYDMCGIVGALGGELPSMLRNGCAVPALDALARRGPDGRGVWVDADAGLWIGHARLAIIDRSSAGTQPMRSASGRWVIALNGEIYNHHELRARVESAGAAAGGTAGAAATVSQRSPADWRGHSDTESLVEHVDAFGLEATLDTVEGMFAFAAWDAAERALHLVRDPLGQKPLYWGWVGGDAWTGGGRAARAAGIRGRASLVFASQLSAIEAMPGFERHVDPAAVAALMRWQCVPGDMSIYQGVHKLAPGHRLQARAGEPPVVSAWWSLGDLIAAGTSERCALLRTPAARANAFSHAAAAVREAVHSQLEADVPLGVLLSGGIDSSLVLALAQERLRESGAGPVHAFTVGFGDIEHGSAHDESEAAAAVAGALGARHHVLHATRASVLAAVPSLASMYDEPFADSSQVPTTIVARLARQHVGVALTGDGGDEMFGGYRRHWAAAHVWPVASALPRPLRSLLGRLACWRTRRDDALMPRAQAAQKLAQVLEATCIEDAHWSLASSWRQEWPLADRSGVGAVAANGDSRLSAAAASRPSPPDWSAHSWWGSLTPAERSIALDTLHYLPDDILVKVDRAAMHTGLETRAPLLDTRVVAVAWHLPLDVRMGQRGKHVLRTMLSEYLPAKMIDRPKHGFSAPIEQWLRGPLREWAESLLRPAALEGDGFDTPVVRRSWDAVRAGRRDARDIWTVLMYRAWRERSSG